MVLDEMLPYPGFKIKNISCKEDSNIVRIHLTRKEDSPLLCYKCCSPLESVKSFSRCKVEDLTVLERKIIVHFRRLKGKCPNCKKYRLEYINWLSPHNPKMTSRLALFLFKLCEVAPVSRIAKITGRNKMTAWRNDLVMLQAQMEHYKIPNVTSIAVDEVYARGWHDADEENRDDRFFTIVSDLKTRKIIWVEDSRRKAALDHFFKKIGPERCQKITVAATDQHDDYKKSIEEHCPNATHVYDRFHLVKNFEESVNKTRKRLYKMLPQKEVKELAKGKFRFIFLKAADKRTEEEQSHMAKLLKDNEAFINLELIKERWLTFFWANDPTEALAIFNEIGVMITEAGFPELKKWWRNTMKNWKTIINYFTHRVSTALSEGINNVIKAVKRRAFGFKNMEYFKLKIMQQCGFLSSDFMGFDGKWTPKALALFEESNA